MLDNMRLEGRREDTQLIYTQIWSYHNKEETRIATTIFVSTAGHVVIAGIARCFPPAAQSTVPLPLASTLAGHGLCSFPLALITRPGSTESPLHSEWKCGVVGQGVNRSAVGSSTWLSDGMREKHVWELDES